MNLWSLYQIDKTGRWPGPPHEGVGTTYSKISWTISEYLKNIFGDLSVYVIARLKEILYLYSYTYF
jgi:hypothetical protein